MKLWKPTRRLLIAGLAAPAIIKARADDLPLLGVGTGKVAAGGGVQVGLDSAQGFPGGFGFTTFNFTHTISNGAAVTGYGTVINLYTGGGATITSVSIGAFGSLGTVFYQGINAGTFQINIFGASFSAGTLASGSNALTIVVSNTSCNVEVAAYAFTNGITTGGANGGCFRAGSGIDVNVGSNQTDNTNSGTPPNVSSATNDLVVDIVRVQVNNSGPAVNFNTTGMTRRVGPFSTYATQYAAGGSKNGLASTPMGWNWSPTGLWLWGGASAQHA